MQADSDAKYQPFLMSILLGLGCPDKVLGVFSPMDRKGICQAGRGEVCPPHVATLSTLTSHGKALRASLSASLRLPTP